MLKTATSRSDTAAVAAVVALDVVQVVVFENVTPLKRPVYELSTPHTPTFVERTVEAEGTPKHVAES